MHTSPCAHVDILVCSGVLLCICRSRPLDPFIKWRAQHFPHCICKAVPAQSLLCCCKAHFLISIDRGRLTRRAELQDKFLCFRQVFKRVQWNIKREKRLFFLSLFYSMTSDRIRSWCEAWCPKRADVPGLPFHHVNPLTRVPLQEWKRRDRWKQQRGDDSRDPLLSSPSPTRRKI